MSPHNISFNLNYMYMYTYPQEQWHETPMYPAPESSVIPMARFNLLGENIAGVSDLYDARSQLVLLIECEIQTSKDSGNSRAS